ncbi:MAG: cupin domain-containing protein [Pseudomonadales bacterium]
MREGETIRPGNGERVTGIRSGLNGGPLIFEFERKPGGKGPPTHTHDESDETIEVIDGEIVSCINGEDRLLRAGDRCTLTPAHAHTFWNPSKTNPVRAIVTRGSRFERMIAQPRLTAMFMYGGFVDSGVSRPRNSASKLLGSIVAWIGRLRGVRITGVG